MYKLLVLLLLALPAQEQKVEYLLDVNCVERSEVVPEKFHCVVDNPQDPKGVRCDNGSTKLVIKADKKLKDCVYINITPRLPDVKDK